MDIWCLLIYYRQVSGQYSDGSLAMLLQWRADLAPATAAGSGEEEPAGEAAPAEGEAAVSVRGLGRIVALHHRSSTSYHIR
jgi:hypothetical protein